MADELYRYTFTRQAPADEVEATLLLSLFAVESLHGEDQACLDASFRLDRRKRACVIDASTAVGRDLARVFTGLLRREFGPDAFAVERVTPAGAPEAAGCLGNARVLLLKRGWAEPSVLWSLTVAESGGHKSPAYHAVVDPLMDLQMDLYDQHQLDRDRHQRELEEWQARPKDERGDRPEPPEEPPTFVTSDATIEALGQLLEDRPKGLLLARDELDAWFKSFTRYKGKAGGSDRPQWLELHRAGTLRIDRLTRERPRLAVRRAAVSITGTIQPAVLAGAFDEDSLHAGLGARFLLAMPPRRKRVWSEAELPDDLLGRYRQLLAALLALPLADERKRKPHVLGLSAPAHRLWVDFYVVQGSGADGVKAALALLWERRGEVPGAFPVLVVHDEVVVECDEGQAGAAAAWLKQAMLDGLAPLLEPVPVEVEVRTAPSWGGD
jgi:hypothetical protein